MSPVESWLVSNSIEIVAFVVFGIMAYAKLGGIAENRKGLEEHKKDPDPHKACPAHAQLLRDMKTSIDEIRDKIELIDSRVYELFKDGRSGR